MITIGITGGVGAGKSTVLDFLEEKYQAYVMKADEIGHLVMEPGQVCYEPVIALFGKQVIKNDKTIDRRQISDVVFSHPELLEKLNQIIHPAVKQYIKEQLEIKKQQGQKVCVVEAALLLEDHYQEFCDTIWYIHTDEEIRIQRLMENRGYTREKSASIIASQAPESFFRENADYVVVNNGNFAQTRQQIEDIFLKTPQGAKKGAPDRIHPSLLYKYSFIRTIFLSSGHITGTLLPDLSTHRYILRYAKRSHLKARNLPDLIKPVLQSLCRLQALRL